MTKLFILASTLKINGIYASSSFKTTSYTRKREQEQSIGQSLSPDSHVTAKWSKIGDICCVMSGV